MNTTTVIVGACFGNDADGYRSVGNCRRIDHYNTAGALADGEARKAVGVAVIVRPNYNESDSEGRYFREWRSFNGQPFKECRWRIGPVQETSPML